MHTCKNLIDGAFHVSPRFFRLFYVRYTKTIRGPSIGADEQGEESNDIKRHSSIDETAS